MITERDIAEKFSVIWKQHFPMLTSNFMRVFNEAQILKVNEKSIPIEADIRYDIVSELAFNLSHRVFKDKLDLDKFLSRNEEIAELVKDTAKVIWRSGKYSEKDLVISGRELSESKMICENILEFIDRTMNSSCEFKPKLKGFGAIPDLIADISIGDTLYEIKTVNRNFRSSDLKQLFLYLALKQVTGDSAWIHGGLYNPRRGIYCRFNVKSLIYNLSGGRSSNEVFENLLNSLTRDVQIDSRF